MRYQLLAEFPQAVFQEDFQPEAAEAVPAAEDFHQSANKKSLLNTSKSGYKNRSFLFK